MTGREKSPLTIEKVVVKPREKLPFIKKLQTTDLKGIFDHLRRSRELETPENSELDVQILELLPPFLRLPVAVSNKAVMDILSDRERGMGLLPLIIEKVLGGAGTLTVNYETGAANAVRKHFGKKVMNTAEFATDLRERTSTLLQQMTEHPNIHPEKVILDLRLQYLSHVFLSDEMDDEEIRAAFEFVNVVFSDLQSFIPPFLKSFFSRAPIDRYLSEEQKRQSTQITQAIERIIRTRKLTASDRIRKNDFFDTMIDEMVSLGEINLNTLDRKQILKIRSNFLQVLFASAETTSSALRSILYAITQDQTTQQRLRDHAVAFLETKQRLSEERNDPSLRGLKFEDLNSDNRDLGEIMKLVGEILHVYAPTFAAARGRKSGDLFPRNPVGVLADLSSAAGENLEAFMQIQRPRINDIMVGGEFGAGGKVCKGGPFAIYDLVQTLITFLTETERISLVDPGEEIWTTTYQRKEMKLNIVPKAKNDVAA